MENGGILERLERNRQVVFRYVTASGEATDAANPNGSIRKTLLA